MTSTENSVGMEPEGRNAPKSDSTLSPKGEAPVGWRTRCRDGEVRGPWRYGENTHGWTAAEIVASSDEHESEPLFLHPSAQPKADREAIARIIVDRTGAGTLGLTDAASMAAALPLADEIIAALTTQGDAG